MSNKIYEVNGKRSEYPLSLDLCKANGGLEDYFLIKGDAKEKITLGDMVNRQIEIINNDASKEDNARNASSGNNAQNASSGNYAQNVSSGDNTRNASSGYNAQNASSGNYTRNASSGDNARNASSGNYAQNVSSGDNTRNASSGYNTQNASSGYNTRNASSGNYAQNEVTGKNSIVFDCGFKSTIKAVNGTWGGLAEYKNVGNIWIPCFGLIAQIGNPDYLDADGEPLGENETYILYNKKFTKTIFADGILLIKKSSKTVKGLTVYRTEEPYNPQSELKYLVFDGENYSHGKTLKEAKESLIYKISNRDTTPYKNWINNPDLVLSKEEAIKGYRAITGACEAGTRAFINSLDAVPDKLSVKELCDRTMGQWGHSSLERYINKGEE